MEAPRGSVTNVTSEQALQRFLRESQGKYGDWRGSPPERVQVNGLPFVHADWSGKEKKAGRNMHGFYYVFVETNQIVVLTSQEFDSGEADLKVADASALTFRRH